MDRDYILAPQVVNIEFDLNPVASQAQSLCLLTEFEDLAGLDGWIQSTAEAMTPDLRRENELMCTMGHAIMLGAIIPPLRGEYLPQFMDRLTVLDAHEIVAKLKQRWQAEFEANPAIRAALGDSMQFSQMLVDREAYARAMQIAMCQDTVSDLWFDGLDLLSDPPAFILRLRNHVHMMWDLYLSKAWQDALPLLQESLHAFQRSSFDNLTLYEAVRSVTGRDMQGKLDVIASEIERVVFTPAAHLGPYIAKFVVDKTLCILFSARLPRGMHSTSSALSRSELLIRMNALADDTRLQILEMLVKHDELRAQDIITSLGLSQSSVSRHLSQLSATGFLVERRRDVNKYYSLNVDRVMDTIRALTSFMSRQ